MPQVLRLRGVAIHTGLLLPDAQAALVTEIRAVVRAAPLFRPQTARGQPMSVRMTSAGAVGWVSDRRGYRYDPHHPSGIDWPPIPLAVLSVWRQVAPAPAPDPDTCLINYYDAEARMGLHQDRDEAELSHPVVSISLGDDALFRVGNLTRGGATEAIWLRSGDVAVLAGEARLLYHGIDRLRPGSSSLLPQGGRLNLTLRVAGPTGVALPT